MSVARLSHGSPHGNASMHVVGSSTVQGPLKLTNYIILPPVQNSSHICLPLSTLFLSQLGELIARLSSKISSKCFYIFELCNLFMSRAINARSWPKNRVAKICGYYFEPEVLFRNGDFCVYYKKIFTLLMKIYKLKSN